MKIQTLLSLLGVAVGGWVGINYWNYTLFKKRTGTALPFSPFKNWSAISLKEMKGISLKQTEGEIIV